MKCIHELSARLNDYFAWDKRRMDCCMQLMLGMLMFRTVNLRKLSQFGNGVASHYYRRLQRFFSQVHFNYEVVAKLLFTLCGFSQGKHYLILDRTNWQWGKAHINILMLSMSYKGFSIPILWTLLPHKGNSSTRIRKALLSRFIRLFGTDVIGGLLGDREFIGQEWFTYLEQHNIPFYFRIKKDADTRDSRNMSVQVGWLFHDLKSAEQRYLKGLRPIYGHRLHVWGARSPDKGELMIVATNQAEENAITHYLNRWQIETLFGCLKSKGFNFEETHMTQRFKLKKLVAVLAIVYAWSIITGHWKHINVKTIKLKRHGRKEKSIFRYGADEIQKALIQMWQGKCKPLKKLVRLIMPDKLSAAQCGVLR